MTIRDAAEKMYYEILFIIPNTDFSVGYDDKVIYIYLRNNRDFKKLHKYENYEGFEVICKYTGRVNPAMLKAKV